MWENGAKTTKIFSFLAKTQNLNGKVISGHGLTFGAH